MTGTAAVAPPNLLPAGAAHIHAPEAPVVAPPPRMDPAEDVDMRIQVLEARLKGWVVKVGMRLSRKGECYGLGVRCRAGRLRKLYIAHTRTTADPPRLPLSTLPSLSLLTRQIPPTV